MKTSGLRWLLAILLFGLIVRLVGIDVLLPHRKEPDTYMVDQAIHLKVGGPERLARNAILNSKYPHVMAYLLAFILPDDLQRVADMEAASQGVDAPEKETMLLQAHLREASRPLLWGRILSALISALLLPGVWLLTRRFAGWGPALFATLLAASSLLHVVYAKQARPHGAEATFILFAILSFLKLRSQGKLKYQLLAGLCAGLAICVLQSGFFVLPALFTAYLLMESGKKRSHLKILVPLLIISLCLWAFYPLDSATWTRNFKVGGLQHGLLNFQNSCFTTLPIHLWEYDPVLVGLALLGLGFLLREFRRNLTTPRKKELRVILTFALPYSLIIGLYGQNQVRYLLPLVPFLAALGALGATRALPIFTRGLVKNRWVPACCAVLILSLPVFAVCKLAYLHTRPDTMTLASQWIAENVDNRRARILTEPSISLPLYTSHAPIRLKGALKLPWLSPWGLYQKARIPWPEERRTWDVLGLLDTSREGNKFPREVQPLIQGILSAKGDDFMVLMGDANRLRRLIKSQKKKGLRCVAFFPVLEGDLGALGINRAGAYRLTSGYQDHCMLRRVLNGVAWGPPLEIYSWSRTGSKEVHPSGSKVRE